MGADRDPDDDELRKARASWVQPDLEGEITFSFLDKKCSFLAAESVRQFGVPAMMRSTPAAR